MNAQGTGSTSTTSTVARDPIGGLFERIDETSPYLGPGLFALAVVLLFFGLWLKWKDRRRNPPSGPQAGLC